MSDQPVIMDKKPDGTDDLPREPKMERVIRRTCLYVTAGGMMSFSHEYRPDNGETLVETADGGFVIHHASGKVDTVRPTWDSMRVEETTAQNIEEALAPAKKKDENRLWTPKVH